MAWNFSMANEKSKSNIIIILGKRGEMQGNVNKVNLTYQSRK